MAMRQMIRHFSGSPPAGSLFPADVAPHASMHVVARYFICRFSQVLDVQSMVPPSVGMLNDASLKRFIAERYLEING
jgi:hypothetical protein